MSKFAKGFKKAVTGLTAFAMVASSFFTPANMKAKAASDELTVPKFDTAPTIDGKVDESEWGSPLFKVKDGEENIFLLDEGGVFPDAFEADVYMGYDSTHIYIAAVAEYDIHKNEALLPTDLWAGDCLQIQISYAPGTDRNELGFTFNSLTNKQQAVAWMSTGNFNMEGGEGADYIVYRDGTTTVYEIALGIEQFTDKISEFTEGMTLPFSLAFHKSTGGFIEYCSGIVAAKDINKAALIGLGGAPDASAQPPVDENPANENAVDVNQNLLDTRETTGNRNVPGKIEAEDYNELYGTEIHISESCPDDDTTNLGWTADRDYMLYKGVNFTSVPDGLNLRVSGTGTPTVQVRLDSVDGTKIAEVQIEASGNWDEYITVSTDLINTDALTGTHDVYVLINGGMNINWFEFTGNAGASEEQPASPAELPESPAKNMLVLPRMAAPTLDGKVSPEEWGNVLFSVKDGEDFITLLDEGGVFPEGFAADIYMGYDSTHVYIAAVAEYDIHKNEALLPTDLWAGDCMQLQISYAPGTDRNELGFTINSLTNSQQSVAWMSAGNFNMTAGEDYVVYREGTTTVYEIALGVEQFTNKITELTDGMTLPFSLAFHMSTGGFLEYCSGIVAAKDINQAGLIGLSVVPDASAQPPVEEVTPGNEDAVDVNQNLIDTRETTGNRNVPGKIEAEDYNELYGTEIHISESCPDDDTTNLGWTADRDYIVYKGVNFTAVPDGLNLRVSGTGTPNVQVRLDSVDGTKIAEVQIEASGSWDEYITVSTGLLNTDALTGTHDVYVLINGGMNINWIEFTGKGGEVEQQPETPADPTPTEVPEEPTPTEEPEATPTDAPEETPSTAPAASSSTDDGGSNTVVIVIVVIVVIAVVAAVVVVLMKKKKDGGNGAAK